MKQLIENIKLHKQTPVVMLSCFLGFFLVGFAILCTIMKLDETAVSWGPLGTIFALLGLIVFAVISFLSYHQDFMLALSMGRTRREFMVTYALEQLIWTLLAYACLLCLALLERGLYTVMFPWAYEDFNIFPYLTDWRIVAASILALILIPMFLGALYSRFGKTFGIILYFVWIGACLLLPRMVNHFEELEIAKQPGVGAMIDWIGAIPFTGWCVLGLVAAAAMLITTVHLGMKQQVR